MTKKDINHMADLAQLHLTDKEKETYASQLKDILAIMEQLSKADISKIEPASYSLGEANILREDEVKKFTAAEALLKNVPDRYFDFIKVKK